uniref:Putative transcriptional regulatory protein n=1 Tax=Talaromyces marneffei PM1 TaxID=1077442 RepID=A0A093UMJ9_TALMA
MTTNISPPIDEVGLSSEHVDTHQIRVSRPSSRDQTSRRTACDKCRGRKVRCDQVHPVCGRCQSLGHKCEYTAHRRPETTKPDLSQALLTLHERLACMEAQLAITQRPIPYIDPSSTASARATYTNPPLSFDPTESHLSPEMESSGERNSEHEQKLDVWQQSNFDFDSLISASENLDFGFDMPNMTCFPSLVPSVSTEFTASDVEPSHGGVDLQILYGRLPYLMIYVPNDYGSHQAYFNYVHTVIPMVNRHRFSTELEMTGHRPELKSLSYSVALLGATVMSDEVDTERSFYNHARSHLNAAESDDEATDFNSLNMLQTLILITYYEFRRTSFARAWLSLGRANRLANMLGLHVMDQDKQSETQVDFILPLPESVGLAEIEERRRSFWVLFTFDVYASIRTGSKTSINGVISTALPYPGDYFDGNLGQKMPTLSKAVDVLDRSILSSFAGIILVTFLYHQCHNHFTASTSEPSYHFWQYHYQINKELSFYRTELLGHLQPINNLGDPLALTLHATLCAIQITLHEHAIRKVQNDNLPDPLRVESDNRCTSIAMQIAEYANVISQLQDSKVSNVTRSPVNLIEWLRLTVASHWSSMKPDVRSIFHLRLIEHDLVLSVLSTDYFLLTIKPKTNPG